MTLASMPEGVRAVVVRIDESKIHSLRLMEMGLVPGAPVRLVKAAPLGDPIQVCVRDYHLALRRSEARAIAVEVCGDE